MTDLVIVPKQGLGPVRLGMSPAEVAAALGEPESETPVEDYRDLNYPNFLNVSFRDGVAFQIGATRRARSILYDDIDIFQAEPFGVLRQIEQDAGSAFLCYGFVVFPALGLTLTGFHDDDLDQKAMTVFAEGTWDELEASFEPISFLDRRA